MHALRRVARYVRIFGIGRTLAKVRGRYHMRASGPALDADWVNPGCAAPDHPDRAVAMVGCGNFPFATAAYFMAQGSRRFLRWGFDIDGERSKSLVRHYSGYGAAASYDRILADPKVKLVFIAASFEMHAEYAIKALDAGKAVHVEKPHVTNFEQLRALVAAMARNPGKLHLGFNRPRSPHFKLARELLAAESGPLMVSWSIVGHKIPDDHWYYSARAGGRVLGNLVHWTDVTLRLLPTPHAFPVEVVPMVPADSRANFVLSMRFNDDSLACITFSAKEEPFDGVREQLFVHKGKLVLRTLDFQRTEYDVDQVRKRFRTWHRQQGHRENVLNSLASIWGRSVPAGVEETWTSGVLLLAAKHAVESGIRIRVDAEGNITELEQKG